MKVDEVLMLVDEYGQTPARSREATKRYKRLREAIKLLGVERDLLLITFRHYHVNSQDGTDRCKQCGLDLLHPIHTRIAQ